LSDYSILKRVRAVYRDLDGQPTYAAFLRAHGLTPQQERYQWHVVFKAAYPGEAVRSDEGATSRGPLIAVGAKAVYTDVEVTRERSYRAANKALPVWDARVYQDGERLIVGGYSPGLCEKPVAEIDEHGRLQELPTFYSKDRFPILSLERGRLIFDPFQWRLSLLEPAGGAPVEERASSFLPLQMYLPSGAPAQGLWRIEEQVTGARRQFLLLFDNGAQDILVAKATAEADSLLSAEPGYAPQLGPGCTQALGAQGMVVRFKGEFAETVSAAEDRLVLLVGGTQGPGEPAARPYDTGGGAGAAARPYDAGGRAGAGARPYDYGVASARPRIVVDGLFDDWRNVPGVSDAQGDKVSYLHYNPDVDLLEFKVANDDTRLYLYSRVLGKHGNTAAPAGGRRPGRYYWYVYIDVDQNTGTGYIPTRDDDCYFGVDIGDDSEVQFEFVGGRFIKTFWGFTGVGTEKEVLAERVHLGPSFYSPEDEQGRPRDRYKVEYVRRGGKLQITEDYTEGTSEDIVMALSPDGSEVEVAAEFSGFLRDQDGRPIMSLGQTLNCAVGCEATTEVHGPPQAGWSADSSPVLYGYRLR